MALYRDGPGKERVDEITKLQKETFRSVALPLYVIVTPDGKEITREKGLLVKDNFLEWIRKAQTLKPVTKN